MKGLKDHEAAAREAFEEAGVIGRVHTHPMGAYTYSKVMGGVLYFRVMVYLLAVEQVLDDWPERGQRNRRWLGAKEAANLVIEPNLSAIILRSNAVPRRD